MPNDLNFNRYIFKLYWCETTTIWPKIMCKRL